MKNIILIVFFLLIGFQSIAQKKIIVCEDSTVCKEVQKDENHIYKFVQKKAEPKEGLKKFYEKMSEEFDSKKIPPVDTKYVQITVMLMVEKDGSLSNFTVLKDEFGIAEETIRILKNMPKWNPAQINGKATTSRFSFPIKISVN